MFWLLKNNMFSKIFKEKYSFHNKLSYFKRLNNIKAGKEYFYLNYKIGRHEKNKYKIKEENL